MAAGNKSPNGNEKTNLCLMVKEDEILESTKDIEVYNYGSNSHSDIEDTFYDLYQEFNSLSKKHVTLKRNFKF